MNERRPVRNSMKRLGKMTRRELQDEIRRLDEVLAITARRHAALKEIVDEFQWANRPRQFPYSFTGPRTTK